MYICICKAVTRRELVSAIDSGARTMRELRQQCDVANCCGKCQPEVKGVLAEHTNELSVEAVEVRVGGWAPA